MCRGEKRSFNLFSRRYDKENDTGKTRLFDLINASHQFEEETLQKQFSKKQDIKHLPVVAHQLFQLILSSIREHSGKEYGEIQVSKMIDDALLLYHRGLFQESKKQVLKAKQIAYEVDYYHIIPQILLLEDKIQGRLLNLKKLQKFKEKHWKEQEDVLAILQNQMEYGKLSDKIYFTYRQYGITGNDEDRQRYSQIMSHPLLEHPSFALSLSAKGAYHTLHSIYYNAIQDFLKAQKHILLLINLYESNLQYMRFRIEIYLSINNNAMFTALRLKDYSNLFQIISKLRQLPIQFPKLEAFYLQRIFEITYSVELSFYVQEGKIEKGINLVPAIQTGLNKFPLKGIGIDRYMRISIGVAIIYFFDGQLDEAKKWINKVMALEKEKVGLQVVGYAKILDILIHFEWGNFLFLQNYIPTVRQFLKRHQRLFVIENELIKLIKKLSQAITKIEREKLINQYLEKLNKNYTDVKSNFLITHFKINIWLKSHLENRSFRQLI